MTRVPISGRSEDDFHMKIYLYKGDHMKIYLYKGDLSPVSPKGEKQFAKANGGTKPV